MTVHAKRDDNGYENPHSRYREASYCEAFQEKKA